MLGYEFTKAETRSMVTAYKGGTGMVSLAETWGVSVPVIRRVLTSAGVKIRGRGRPRIDAA